MSAFLCATGTTSTLKSFLTIKNRFLMSEANKPTNNDEREIIKIDFL